MNTNNKEAIAWMISAIRQLEDVAKILQDNEDTEVQEECRCIKAANYSEICSCCELETRYPKPCSKVEKLKELKKEILTDKIHNVNDDSHLLTLLTILIEDEE